MRFLSIINCLLFCCNLGYSINDSISEFNTPITKTIYNSASNLLKRSLTKETFLVANNFSHKTEQSCLILKDKTKANSQLISHPFLIKTFAPVEMDLTESIIISVGVLCLIPLMIDLTKQREPNEVSVAGASVFGACFITSLVYRYNFKNKTKKSKNHWE